MPQESYVLDDLDTKVAELFPGLIVRKDLLRRMRSTFSVPMFVIEFLLGKYCSSTDPQVIEDGLEFVRQSLAQKYVKPDEREIVKAKIKQKGSYQIIDKVSVALRETEDKYWAQLSNISLPFVNISDTDIHQHERLLMGGVWAEVTLDYNETFLFKGVNRPFFISKLRPIQLSALDLASFIDARNKLSWDDWANLLLRSMGYEPTNPYFTRRRKLLYLIRLIPLVEKNYNLVELGPRGTGKSFVFQQVSPYCHLVSGGQTTVAQMFVNLGTGQKGLVCLWDVVAFDEAAGVRFQDRNGINIMKGYMEDGLFSRGKDIIPAEGSIVFLGNIDGDIETINRTSHLFYCMPKEMDTAFYDRIHCYVPGWEFEKTRDEFYTDHFGLVADYLAEVFRELRKQSYADVPEKTFKFGSHLSGRDQKAVRKTVSGLIKLLNPNGQVSREELEEYLSVGMEMRRRVKEQLKKMGGLEYWNVNFSYIDQETSREQFVPLPESGTGNVIVTGDLKAGSVYTIGTDLTEHKLALFLIQAQLNPGTGRIVPLGALSTAMRESLKTADAYLRANLKNLGVDRNLKDYDFTIQAINLNQAREGAETGIAFFISMISALLDRPIKEPLVVIGEMTIHGMMRKATSLTERMQMALDAGARRMLISSENKRDLADVPDEVLNKVQPVFYTDPINAAIRAMGLE